MQTVSYGVRVGRDDLADSKSWVTVTDLRGMPWPNLDIALRRSDRWVNQAAGVGFTTYNDTELTTNWTPVRLVTLASEIEYEERDVSSWVVRNTLSWTPLPGGSAALRLYGFDYRDTRTDFAQRGGGWNADLEGADEPAIRWGTGMDTAGAGRPEQLPDHVACERNLDFLNPVFLIGRRGEPSGSKGRAMNRAIIKIGWLLLATGLARAAAAARYRTCATTSTTATSSGSPSIPSSTAARISWPRPASRRSSSPSWPRAAVCRCIDPGETLAAMRDLRYDAAADLSAAQIIELGKRLSVDAVFFGAVDDYGFERENANRAAAVTLSMRLAETQTGTVIWLSQDHRSGTSVWRKLFGGGSASLHDVTRAAVNDCLGSLF